MAHDVFISYSSKDKPTGDAVCATLEANGIRCWIAPRDVVPGQDWGECIIGAIKGARIMVLVFSANANYSPQIKREVERAVNHGLIVIPLRIEKVAPSPSLEYFISTPHWLDAFTLPLEKHLQNLTQVILKALGRVPEAAATGALPPPLVGAVVGEDFRAEPAVGNNGRKVMTLVLSVIAALGIICWWFISRDHHATNQNALPLPAVARAPIRVASLPGLESGLKAPTPAPDRASVQAASSKQSREESQYQTYLNEKIGLQLKFPKMWTISGKKIPGMIVGFVSPKESGQDKFIENVAVTTTDLSKKPMTLEQFAIAAAKQMQGVFSILTDAEIVSVDLSGHPGKKISLQKSDRVVVIYSFIYQMKAYNITYMGTPDRYAKEAPIFTDMINSLKVDF